MVFSLPVILLLTVPLIKMTTGPSLAILRETLGDKDVRLAIARSLGLSLTAGILAFALGTPLSYLLARKKFPGKKSLRALLICRS